MNEFKNVVPYNSIRNWEEDFSHENGKYQNKCIECRNLFLGHKRRILCKICNSTIDELRAKVEEQELIIYGIEEGAEQWKSLCSDKDREIQSLTEQLRKCENEKNEILKYYNPK